MYKRYMIDNIFFKNDSCYVLYKNNLKNDNNYYIKNIKNKNIIEVIEDSYCSYDSKCFINTILKNKGY